jgi:hypothetical protein
VTPAAPSPAFLAAVEAIRTLAAADRFRGAFVLPAQRAWAEAQYQQAAAQAEAALLAWWAERAGRKGTKN